MHRLPMIFSAAALLAAIVSTGLYFKAGESKHLLEQRLADSENRSVRLERDLMAASERAGALSSRIAALDLDLNLTREKLAAADSRAGRLDRELTDTRTVLSFYENTTRSLGEEITALRRDLDTTRASNASPEAVSAYKSTIAELERQLAAARNGTAIPSAAGASTAVFTNRAGRASVLTVGPANAFVVLNFGKERGAKLGQKMTVHQGAAIVAVVQLSDVRTRFSVAQVLPETLRGVLQKGDSALLVQ